MKTIDHQIVDAVHFSLLVNDSVEGNQVIMGPISPTYKPAITGRPKLRTVSLKRTDEKRVNPIQCNPNSFVKSLISTRPSPFLIA